MVKSCDYTKHVFSMYLLCCCLSTPLILVCEGSPIIPLLFHQPAYPSIWPKKVCKDRSHGQGGLLIFIHRSITFPKQPSSPESLSDPHLEELSIKAELGNTKLIISNVYIPPASSCSNGYHSSIEHLLTTPDTLILGDFNAHHPSWYSRSTDTRGRKMADSINGSDYGILNWDSLTRVPPNAERSSPDVSLASASLITSCSRTSPQ